MTKQRRMKIMNEIRISAKNLGAIAMPNFCPKCFWIKNNIKKIPWQIFPGIFSSIDAYTKKMVHYIFDTTGKPPVWLPEIEDAVKYLKVPWHTKFFRKDTETGITVSGIMDDLFECKDGSRIIPDYKTAKFTKNADKLFPIYEVQLNMYSWIEEGFGSFVRPELPLIYCEPVTEPDKHLVDKNGFLMPFAVKTLIVKKNPVIVRDVLDKAAEIVFNPMPASSEDCKDCDAFNNITLASEVGF